jgi:hypothetical protein
MNAVSEHLHHLAPVSDGDLVHEICQRQRDMSGDFVSRLLGQSRVAREVGEKRCFDPLRRTLADPGLLEGRFDVSNWCSLRKISA